MNNIAEWICTLEPIEQAYAKECFKFWNKTNGETEPRVPDGISKPHAETIKYHVQALNNGCTGRRKVEETTTISLRISTQLKDTLHQEAAVVKKEFCEYFWQCLNAGRVQVIAFPNTDFSNPCLQR